MTTYARSDAGILVPDGEAGGIGAFPAQVRTLASQAALTAALEARVMDPAILTERTPFFWQATISTNAIDSYSTRMGEDSLRNYAEDAQAGVAFQNSHNTRELSLGQSLYGDYKGPGGDGVAHVDAAFYTFEGLRLGSLNTDQFRDGIRSGIIRDVSIGFYIGPGGAYRCSICGRDMLTDWDCWHYPGYEYDLRDDEGHKTGQRAVAIATVEGAHLSEVSAVYDGACPGAVILKAQRDAPEGRLDEKTARWIENRYHMRFAGPRVSIPRPNGAPAPAANTSGEGSPEEDRMTAATRTTPTTTPAPARRDAAPASGDLADAAAAAGVATTDTGQAAGETTAAEAAAQTEATTTPPDAGAEGEAGASGGSATDLAEAAAEASGEAAAVERARQAGSNALGIGSGTIAGGLRAALARSIGAAVAATTPPVLMALAETELDRLRSQVAELEPIAVDGRAYRARQTAEAIRQGKRALGATFNEAGWTTRLAGMDMEAVTEFLELWKSTADATLGNGRVTADDTGPIIPPSRQAPVKREVPMAAYSS